MPPRRILHVVYSLNVGGIETWLTELAERNDWTRFHLDFCYVGRAGAGFHAQRVRQLGAQVWPCRLGRDLVRFSRSFRRALRGCAYDVVHAHLDPGLILKLAHDQGVPVRVGHYHSTLPRQSRGLMFNLYGRWQNRWARKHATVVLAVSEAVMDAAYQRQWRSDPRFMILPTAVDVGAIRGQSGEQARRRARAELGLHGQEPVVGALGRMVPAKNHECWLRAAELIKRSVPQARFLVVGDGPLRAPLQRQAARLGLSEPVIFTGLRRDVPALLAAMDVLLSTSSWEGLPRSVLEAEAAGVPVVAGDIPAHREALPASGVFFDGTPQAPAAAVLRVLSDRRLREDLIARQFAHVGRFDIGRITPFLEQLYSGLPPRAAADWCSEASNRSPCPTA